MQRNLATARETFITAMKRETSGAELVRLIAVLDALIKWSVARPKSLAFQASESANGALGFQLAGSKTMFWSARVMRGDAPKLEIYPATGRLLDPEVRARVMSTLNAISRSPLADDRGLCVGFGALKNAAAREAVLAQLEELTKTAPAVRGQAAVPAPAITLAS
jgi:hypothetical protein